MEFSNIIQICTMIFGGGGALAGLFALKGNRRLAAAQAKQAEEQAKQTEAQTGGAVVDYAGKIIEQTDKIIAQYDKRIQRAEGDAIIWKNEVAKTEEYAKEQRLANNDLRKKLMDEQKSRHKAELALKDFEAKYKEADWHRCEVNGCSNRMPPRTRSAKIENQ